MSWLWAKRVPPQHKHPAADWGWAGRGTTGREMADMGEGGRDRSRDPPPPARRMAERGREIRNHHPTAQVAHGGHEGHERGTPPQLKRQPLPRALGDGGSREGDIRGNAAP